jgi:hypothetical protein
VVRTFIVRLHTEAGPDLAAPRLRGVVDEVATGSRATFHSDQELVTALLAAISDGPADPPGDSGTPPRPSPAPGNLSITEN